MGWPLSDQDRRDFANLRIDRVGWILGIGAYLILVVLLSLSVAGIIEPPITIPQRGADMTDEELLGPLLAVGFVLAPIAIWVKIGRSSTRED